MCKGLSHVNNDLSPPVGQPRTHKAANGGKSEGKAMAEVQFKLWIEEDDKVLFGGGRLKLLKAVVNQGSLAGAARELNMSYRAAWGRLRASEKRLGFALVERSDAGRREVQLTPQGLKMVKQFELFEKQAQDFADKAQKNWSKLVSDLRGEKS